MKTFTFQKFSFVSVTIWVIANVCWSSRADGADPPPLVQRPVSNVRATSSAPILPRAYSADGAYFAFAAKDGKVRYCRVSDGSVLRMVYHCCPRALAFSSDGMLLATAGGCDPQKTVKVWRLADGQTLARLSNGDADALRLGFSPDSEFLVCHNGQSGLVVWHLPKQELRWKVSLASGDIPVP